MRLNYLADGFGGKRALARLVWHFLLSCSGAFGRYRDIDWRRVCRVVFICKGNICRSAFAESRLRAFGLEVASAGLEADSGKPADVRAAKVARGLGADLTDHRSTHFAELELRDGDLLVAFEPDHADRLELLSSYQPGVQVTLLGLWSPLPRLVYLHDPYGLSEIYFETCFQRIERGLQGLRRQYSCARTMTENLT